MSSPIWVAGATGFLGSHISRLLANAERPAVLTSRSGGRVDSIVVSPVDILNSGAVEKSAEGCALAVISTGMVSRDPGDAGELHRLHVEGTRSALVGLKRAGVKRVVVVGTSGSVAVGKNPKEIFDEESSSPMEYIASWPYYRSKYYGELEAFKANQKNFEVVVVCPSLLLGPGDLRESSTGDVRRFLEKAIPATPAGGLAFVDVRDAAQGVIQALDCGRGGERYLLNSSNMSVQAFFSRLSRISGVRAPLMTLPKSHALAKGIFAVYEEGLRALGGSCPVDRMSVEMGQYFWYCSSEKAERELSFVARDPGETIRDTVEDLLERQVVAPVEMRMR